MLPSAKLLHSSSSSPLPSPLSASWRYKMDIKQCFLIPGGRLFRIFTFMYRSHQDTFLISIMPGASPNAGKHLPQPPLRHLRHPLHRPLHTQVVVTPKTSCQLSHQFWTPPVSTALPHGQHRGPLPQLRLPRDPLLLHSLLRHQPPRWDSALYIAELRMNLQK